MPLDRGRSNSPTACQQLSAFLLDCAIRGISKGYQLSQQAWQAREPDGKHWIKDHSRSYFWKGGRFSWDGAASRPSHQEAEVLPCHREN
jgi:hypothetical protein